MKNVLRETELRSALQEKQHKN